MDTTGNCILVTGGATGIGRRFAELFHARGNRVIVASRRRSALDAVVAANPGIVAMELDVADPVSIEAFAKEIVAAHPDLNVVLNNAGIMPSEDFLDAPNWLPTAEATIATNLLGPIRLTAALLPHLLTKPKAAILNVTSGLAFVPKLANPTYSATKAALHSWTMSLRRQLAETGVEAIEIAPPYVATELTGPAQAVDPRAMPLEDFVREAMSLLEAVPTPAEVIVERCRPLRFAEKNGNLEQIFTALAAG
ncbi:MAG: SDR family NAD(P)-dependent oxidoreductase [Phyllobacteriaceae bacterium]|nr:SDR family NAD(P)-dependent oxidoreductase [Phyllobacteriaceae bacterium]